METLQIFYAIDFETANYSLDSICQIGIAEFKEGEVVNKWNMLIDPEDWFSPMNIGIHGITEDMVAGKPTFGEVYNELKDIIENNIVVHHTAFDRTAMNRVCEKYKLEIPQVNWLDSAKVVRRTWEDRKDRGYGLKDVADFIGIDFKHHDALEDAIAAGKILLEAMEVTKLGLHEWVEKIKMPITIRDKSDYSTYQNSIKREGNPDGRLYGEVVLFTGNFSLQKKDLSKFASEMGCSVETSLNNRLSILVVGTQVASVLKGESKSSKHREAEKRIEKGANIRIVTEDDFFKMYKESLSE